MEKSPARTSTVLLAELGRQVVLDQESFSDSIESR